MPLEPVSTQDLHVPAHNEEREAINQLNEIMKTRIGLPPSAAYGDLLWFDGTNWMTTETRFLEGSGRPETKVAGPVGSRYVNKNPDDGGVLWVKTSGGDSTTGWVCVAGNTGLRDIKNQIALRNTGVANVAYLSRVGNTVELYVDMKMPNNTSSPYTIYTLPLGFRPQHNLHGGLTDNKEGADTGGTAVLTNGSVYIYNPVAGKSDRYRGTWQTVEAWPANLPGSPG